MIVPVNPKNGIFWEYTEALPKKRSNVKVRVRLIRVSASGDASILGTAMVYSSEIRAFSEIATAGVARPVEVGGKARQAAAV